MDTSLSFYTHTCLCPFTRYPRHAPKRDKEFHGSPFAGYPPEYQDTMSFVACPPAGRWSRRRRRHCADAVRNGFYATYNTRINRWDEPSCLSCFVRIPVSVRLQGTSDGLPDDPRLPSGGDPPEYQDTMSLVTCPSSARWSRRRRHRAAAVRDGPSDDVMTEWKLFVPGIHVVPRSTVVQPPRDRLVYEAIEATADHNWNLENIYNSDNNNTAFSFWVSNNIVASVFFFFFLQTH